VHFFTYKNSSVEIWNFISFRANQSQIIVHKRSDRENVVRIHPRPDDFETDFVVFFDHDWFVGGFVAGRRRIRIEFHVGWDTVAGDEAGQRADFAEDSNLIHLVDYTIQNFPLERAKNGGVIFDRVDDKPTTRLNQTDANVVDLCNSDNEPVFPVASAFDLAI